MNKAELIAAIRAKRDEFAALCAGLTDEQLIRLPGPQADWSAKDLIAHLAYWEQRTLDELRLGLGGGTVIWESDVDKVNAKVLTESQRRSLGDVRGQFQQTLDDAAVFITSLPDDVYGDPNRYAWLGGRAVWQQIAYEFLEHYDDHMADVRAWRERISLTATA